MCLVNTDKLVTLFDNHFIFQFRVCVLFGPYYMTTPTLSLTLKNGTDKQFLTRVCIRKFSYHKIFMLFWFRGNPWVNIFELTSYSPWPFYSVCRCEDVPKERGMWHLFALVGHFQFNWLWVLTFCCVCRSSRNVGYSRRERGTVIREMTKQNCGEWGWERDCHVCSCVYTLWVLNREIQYPFLCVGQFSCLYYSSRRKLIVKNLVIIIVISTFEQSENSSKVHHQHRTTIFFSRTHLLTRLLPSRVERTYLVNSTDSRGYASTEVL